ncbi:MAG: hypothetical protein PHV19_03225 [Bacilli bacterium]|jgi:hypothetical protein|nr:hypothetical protein [Bacilli bacterium]
MKNKFCLVLPVFFVLSSCAISNPHYPQDELDLNKYQEPAVLDWTNGNLESEEVLFDDNEVLRTFLNNPRAPIKEVTIFENIYHGGRALRLGNNFTPKEGELTFTLKNIFLTDALSIAVYPYYYQTFDYYTGQNKYIYDSFSISINDCEYIDINGNDEMTPIDLTFAFSTSLDEISIKTKGGRAFLFSLSLYQSI